MSTLVQPAPQKLKTPDLPKGADCLVVIFGGTGDLTHRKLIPALYDLACVGCTTRNFQILGIGRTKLDDDEYREPLARRHQDVKGHAQLLRRRLEGFHRARALLHRRRLEAGVLSRAQEEDRRDAERPAPARMYCSTFRRRPRLAPPIVEGLGKVGLARNDEGWTRIILEKPFGSDLTARSELNEMVSHVFRRGVGLSHRSLPRQRDGAEHHDVPLRQLDVRARMEPQLHRVRRDHGGGNSSASRAAARSTKRRARCVTWLPITCCSC